MDRDLGGWTGSHVSGGEISCFNLMSFVWAAVGSLIYRLILRRRHT